MKRYAALVMGVLMLMLPLVSGAAQESMRLYAQEECIEKAQARRLLELLGEDGTPWTLMGEGQALCELVLAGDIPDLAICTPAQAKPWAKEGLLLPLQMHIGGQQRVQRQVLDLCVHEETLFMAPLIAHHRQMAVNRTLMEELGLGYMLDRQAYPVWYPAQFYQIMEEFLLMDETALDVWRAEPDTSAAIEALTQAIFGGMLLSEDGKNCQADGLSIRAGVRWLSDAIDDGMIGYCDTREDALARFLAQETAIFIDWTEALARQLDAVIRENELDIVTVPYPAAAGLPVRSFELAGVCAFADGNAARDALRRKACVILHEHADDILGARGIWQDGALWPASLERDDRTATLRSLLCAALDEVIEGGEAVETALGRVQAAMDVLERTSVNAGP